MRTLLLTLALFTLGCASLPGQATHPVTGRQIAGVMSVAGADWLERSERELEENPEAALNALGIQPGMKVADAGAGVGYFTVRLAKRVGPTGTVYAQDIQPQMLARLRRSIKRMGLQNVETVLGSETNANLPENTLDLVLMVDVYHELSHPQDVLRSILKALKPTGRLVLIEYRKEDPAIPILPEHKMSVQEAKLELEAEGFRLAKVDPVLPRQHILIFEKANRQSSLQ